MPPAANHEKSELTVNEVEQAGRLLLPMFKDAVRTELHTHRGKINEQLLSQTDDLTEKIKAVADDVHKVDDRVSEVTDRVTRIECGNRKVLMIWCGFVATVMFVLTAAWEIAKEFFVHKVIGK